MANYFLPSEQVRVYPAAFRAGTDSTKQAISINPESRLSTEDNVNSRINAITTYRSFLVRALDSDWKPVEEITTNNSFKIECAIHGHVFILDMTKTTITNMIGTVTDGNKVYVKILLKDFTSSYEAKDYTFKTLSDIQGGKQGPLDVSGTSTSTSISDYTFVGITFSNVAPVESDGEYGFYFGTRNGTTIEIDPNAYGRLSARDIFVDSTDTKTLDDLIDDSGELKIELALKLWGNDVTEIDDEIGGTILPTADNTYDLGSSSLKWKNLYVNNINGVPYPDGTKDVGTRAAQAKDKTGSNLTNVKYGQNIYLNKDSGLIGGVSIFYGKTSDPNTLSDFGEEGDIYIFYED